MTAGAARLLMRELPFLDLAESMHCAACQCIPYILATIGSKPCVPWSHRSPAHELLPTSITNNRLARPQPMPSSRPTLHVCTHSAVGDHASATHIKPEISSGEKTRKAHRQYGLEHMVDTSSFQIHSETTNAHDSLRQLFLRGRSRERRRSERCFFPEHLQQKESRTPQPRNAPFCYCTASPERGAMLLAERSPKNWLLTNRGA